MFLYLNMMSWCHVVVLGMTRLGDTFWALRDILSRSYHVRRGSGTALSAHRARTGRKTILVHITVYRTVAGAVYADLFHDRTARLYGYVYSGVTGR